MIGTLVSFVFIYTCFMNGVAANVPSEILSTLTSNDISSINALNPNNSVAILELTDDRRYIASQIFSMEKRILRLSRSVSFGDQLSGVFEDLEYATKETLPVIHLTYLENEERLRGTTGITATMRALSNVPPIVSSVLEVSGMAGSCNYKAFSFQAYIRSGTLEIAHFAVYTNSSGITAGNIVRESRSASGKVVSTISVTNNPKFVVVGTVALAKTEGTPLTEAQTRGIVEIVAGRACEKLETIPTGTCNGTLVTQNGQQICSCPSNYFGETCGIFCVRGNITEVPPTNRKVCKCNFGWGQEGCSENSAVTDFITRARTTAKTCQRLLTGHAEYVFTNPSIHPTGIDPLLDGVVQDTVRQTRFTMPGGGTHTFQFGDLIQTSSYSALMDRTNDLLAAIYISSPIDGRITFEHTASYIQVNPTTVTTEGSGDDGVCSYQYRIVQRFYSGAQQGMAKILFITGVQDISTMPTNSSLSHSVSGSETTDIWKVDGTSMKDIILGFTLLGRFQAGEMSAAELDAVARCYALEACHSIPIDCSSGQQIHSPAGPVCQCAGEWTGIQCRLPLC